MPVKVTIETFINQNLLRQVEALCTQEEPPACEASCPLHLDVRSFLSLVAAGKNDEAWKWYAKAIPLAPLVAFCCDAPCKGLCKRSEWGGAVELGQLEQFVFRKGGSPTKPPFLLPKKTESIAIVGGGLRGMAAANALARKGYQITILEASKGLGGCLSERGENILPQKVLEDEIKTLLLMPVRVEYGRSIPVNTLDEAGTLLEDYAAVFVACSSPLDALADGALLLTGREKVFAGKRAGRLSAGPSAIYDVFDGISAAISIERVLQEVSVSAGREKEGSSPSKLFTNLDGVAAVPPAPAGPDGYDDAGAVQEALRCIRCECNECVKKCAFLQKYTSNPRRYIRMVYNNLSIAMGQHDANGMINSCALCSQCAAICPNGLDMGEVFLAARRQMTHSGKMPPSAYEFALSDMRYSLSDAFFLARHAPGTDSSDALFFPGCQLPASEPNLVRAVYADLRARYPGAVGLMLGCCGVMAHWSGNTAAFDGAKEHILTHWKALGSPRLISACPTCTTTLREFAGIDTVNLFEVLNEIGLPEKAGTRERPAGMIMHHACGARHDEAVKRHVRELAGTLGLTFTEGAPEGASPCCGYGGLASFVNNDLRQAMTETALEQLAGEKTAPLLTYCINCRDYFSAKGRSAWHLLELVYYNTEGLRRKNPTWSQRQENRAALKRQVLGELWGESQHEDEGKQMKLILDEALERKIEATHILHRDIEVAITRAEAENARLLDPKSGHFITSNRPATVTFWVEYAPADGAFKVYNAWCHRMTAGVTGTAGNDGAVYG
jgi:Fe-S oxidoreductase